MGMKGRSKQMEMAEDKGRKKGSDEGERAGL